MYRLKPIHDYPDPIYDKAIVDEYPDWDVKTLIVDNVEQIVYHENAKTAKLLTDDPNKRLITEFLLQQGQKIEFIEEFLYGE